MRSICCENIRCKYYSSKGGCSKANIDINGTCKAFEKGFLYYVFLVWDKLSNSNFIDFVDIHYDPDLRLGIYYICSMYHLIYSESEWGTCRFLRFHQEEGGPALNFEDIQKLPLDKKKYVELYTDFMNENLPGSNQKVNPPKKHSQPFGWLTPAGEFNESAFGTHETAANDIIRKRGYENEYLEWKRKNAGRLCRDFLTNVKGYCLIHNPLANGGYLVSHVKPLTKKQKDFLYGYFSDMGDQLKAEQYME